MYSAKEIHEVKEVVHVGYTEMTKRIFNKEEIKTVTISKIIKIQLRFYIVL